MAFPRQVPHIPRLSEFHELREDVVYAHADGVPLRFDHYRPRKVEGPAPAVIFIHGGAWSRGAPARGGGTALPSPRRGIATVSLSYRLAPAHRFPAPLDDVRHGLRWVRAHAGELGIDPERLALLGLSAGAPPPPPAHVPPGGPGPAPHPPPEPARRPPDGRAGVGHYGPVGPSRRANQAMDAFLELYLGAAPGAAGRSAV